MKLLIREKELCRQARRGSSLRSLLDGVENRVCKVLNICSLRHRSALLDLMNRDSIATGAVFAAYQQIAANWTRARQAGFGSASGENWRWWKPRLDTATTNRSPEVLLERAICRCFQERQPERWANQVPVASGIVGPYAERRRAIDLVERRSEKEFAFIELKVESDTPLYAAFEILFYLCIWLLARAERQELSPLLAADTIRATALAPSAYFAPFALGGLQYQLNEEVANLGKRHGVTLNFGFERFPRDFVIEQSYGDDALVDIMGRREPLS